MHTSVNAMVVLTDDPAAATAATLEMPGRVISGSATQLADTLGRYGEMGFSEFIVPDWNLGGTHDERIEALDRLRSEVFSQLA